MILVTSKIIQEIILQTATYSISLKIENIGRTKRPLARRVFGEGQRSFRWDRLLLSHLHGIMENNRQRTGKQIPIFLDAAVLF